MINKWGLGMIIPILMLIGFSKFIWWLNLGLPATTGTFIMICCLLFIIQLVACSVVHVSYFVSLGGLYITMLLIVAMNSEHLILMAVNLFLVISLGIYLLIVFLEYRNNKRFYR